MRRTLVLWMLVALALCASRSEAQAIQNIVLRNSFNPLGAGARGLGMGGAFIAVADDGTAASFNPAGLAQLRRSEIAVVGFRDRLISDVTFVRQDTGAGSTSSTSTHGAPDFVGLAVPFEAGGRRLTVQLSYQRSVDLFGRGAVVTQDNFPLSELGLDPRDLGLPPSFRFGTLVADLEPDQSGAFHTVAASAGYQATSRLAFGLALDYWIGEWTARGESAFRLLAVSGAPGGSRPTQVLEVSGSTGTFEHEQSLRGLNVTTGFLLRYPRVSVGGVLRLPFAGDYELAQTENTEERRLGQPSTLESDTLSMRSRLRWPRSAGVGIALRPLRGLTLAADYSRSQWSRASLEDVPEGALLTREATPDASGVTQARFQDLNFFDLQPASQTTTLDTSQWRAGGEYLWSLPKVVVPLRAGLFRDRSPVRQIDSQQGRLIRGFTFGTGLNFDRLVFDVAFERRRSEALVGLAFRGGEGVAQNVAPREVVREDRLVASLIYRFGGTDDPLQRALRFLFVGPRDEDK